MFEHPGAERCERIGVCGVYAKGRKAVMLIYGLRAPQHLNACNWVLAKAHAEQRRGQ